MSFILVILVFIVSMVFAMGFAQKHFDVRTGDIDMMFLGIFAFNFLKDMSLFIGALIGGLPVAPYIIGMLINAGLTYWMYRRTGI